MRRTYAIALLLLMMCIHEARAEVVLIMRREAEASGNYIRICDIARVEGPRDLVNEVSLVVLGPTPARGQSQEITRWDIESRLYEMGVAASVTFTGNDMVRVYGSGGGRASVSARPLQQLQPVEPREAAGTADRRLGGGSPSLPSHPAQLAAAVTGSFKPEPRTFAPASSGSMSAAALSPDTRRRVGDAVARFLAGRYPRADMEVEARLLGADGDIPDSVREIHVEEAVDGRVPGKATLRIKVTDTLDAEPRTLTVTADTQVYGLAPVAARQLTRNEELTPEDVIITRVRMESGKGYLPPNSRAVEGRSLKRNLQPGEPVLAADAVPSEAVKRGNLVVVIASGPGWEVKTIGKAQGSGMVGDSITVEDSSTKAKYPARIIGRGRVAMVHYKDQLNKK